MKKCPPGLICMKNMSIVFFVIILFVFGYLIFINLKSLSSSSSTTTEKIIIRDNTPSTSIQLTQTPSYPYNNLPPVNDVLQNPYVPPLRDERYLIPQFSIIPAGTVPINISTNVGAVDTNYRQVGLLTPMNGSNKDKLMPLMGRPLFTNRQKWQYYTMSDQYNSLKLPISVKGRSATNDYGVDELYNGDSVYIEGYNQPYKVTTYDNDTIKYLPYI